MKSINDRITREICNTTIQALSDKNMISEYLNCASVKKSIGELSTILHKHVNEEPVVKQIIEEYLVKLIPAGTKGVMRGNKFNSIVKSHIIGLNLDTNVFDVQFETNCVEHPTTEVPDWYIRNKQTDKIIIGMNQLDLWSGGHQLNRGSKYLLDNKHNNEKSKLLCVVCNNIQFVNNTNNKSYRLFEVGFRDNTLCYLGNLKNIIYSYFEIPDPTIMD